MCPVKCPALEPGEILVLANRNAKDSVRLAKYYMKKRSIPDDHLMVLSTPDGEAVSREDYNSQVADKVRQYLENSDPDQRIRCLVTVYGMPLKIDPPEMSLIEKAELEIAHHRMEALRVRLNALEDSSADEKARIQKELEEIEQNHDEIQKNDQRAALDSELALVKMEAYELTGWLPNPYYVGFGNHKPKIPRQKVLWVSRLDGPTPDIVQRIMDDSLEVEQKGLAGIAYFDARWPKPSEAKNVDAYELYDKSIHKAARQISKLNRMPVAVDEQPGLFGPGRCPDAALYCGWYSLAQYVDAFKWVKGAVGYHIASAECTTLKKAGSEVWCKRMLEEGVAATLGPTSEPYVQAFPLPEVFFALLASGRLTLVEAYMASTPFLSWQMVLIGDPLYRPFHSSNEVK